MTNTPITENPTFVKEKGADPAGIILPRSINIKTLFEL